MSPGVTWSHRVSPGSSWSHPVSPRCLLNLTLLLFTLTHPIHLFIWSDLICFIAPLLENFETSLRNFIYNLSYDFDSNCFATYSKRSVTFRENIIWNEKVPNCCKHCGEFVKPVKKHGNVLMPQFCPLRSTRVSVGQGERQPGGQSLHPGVQRRAPGIRRPCGEGKTHYYHHCCLTGFGWLTGFGRSGFSGRPVEVISENSPGNAHQIHMWSWNSNTLCNFSSGLLQEHSPVLSRRRENVSVPGQHGRGGQHGLQRTQWTAGVQGKRYETSKAPSCICSSFCHQQVSLWYSLTLSLFLNRSLFHPTRQEVGAQGSKVQTRWNDRWRNRCFYIYIY